MNSKIKQIIIPTLSILRMDKVLRKINKIPRILFYHGVSNVIREDVETDNYDPVVFEKQIKYLIKYYEIISIEEFEKRFENNSFTNNEIVLTFDDGFANNLYVAAPILIKYNLPFTVFVSTEHISTGQFYPTTISRIIIMDTNLKKINIPSQDLIINLSNKKEKTLAARDINKLIKTLPLKQVRQLIDDLISNVCSDEWAELLERYKTLRPMNWNEVIELSKYATIGSHCKFHMCCHAKQDVMEVKKQIIESKSIIEEKILKRCNYFAYPNGDFTSESNVIVGSTYKMGFSTKRVKRISQGCNPSIIPRIGASRNFDEFKITLNLNPKK